MVFSKNLHSDSELQPSISSSIFKKLNIVDSRAYLYIYYCWMWFYEQGDPTASYRRACWIWEISGWSSRLYRQFVDPCRGTCRIYLISIKENRKNINTELAGLGNAWISSISTEVAQNLPGQWCGQYFFFVHSTSYQTQKMPLEALDCEWS